MIFQFTAVLYCHPFQRSYNQPRTFTRFQKYIIVKFILKSKYNRWKYSFFRSNEFIVILSRDKRQGNRATEGREKKNKFQVFSHESRGLGKLCPSFVNWRNRSRKKLVRTAKSSNEKATDGGRSSGSTPFMGINFKVERACRVRAPIGAEVARYQREGPVNLYREWKWVMQKQGWRVRVRDLWNGV